MDYLPIFVALRGRACLVIGGGEVAARKAEMLLRAHANVTAIALEFCPAMSTLAITRQTGSFTPDMITDQALVYAATNDADVNQHIYRVAFERNIPVNVADDPALCTFIMPSIIDRSPVVAAVSTGGASPVLARQIRARLESLIPSAYGRLARFVEGYRTQVTAALPANKRAKFWECLLQGEIPELVFSGKEAEAHQALTEKLANPEKNCQTSGEVYLIGAGPGDPDLLTFRALRLMQQADVVVYDRLVSAPVMDLLRRDAEKIYVGKERDKHTMQQENINELLVRLAKEGKRVCRLKGGDPFIFGRGGEEIDLLAQNNIPFRVVPGITAASGMAAYAGIPLTHRDYAQSVTFVTGHLKQDGNDLNWQALAAPHQTLVFYMGLHGLQGICDNLMAHGVDPDMPAALVQKATTPEQRELIGTLASLPDIAKSSEITPPTLVVVGEVIQLHQKLKWFETQNKAEHEPRVF
jgi:uroporphyrin-III C-methyltransferase / precorrin-2 dehydrogenase / sirohydrochlorin ferrochelatase